MKDKGEPNGVFLDDLVRHFRELAERLQKIDSAVPPEGLAPAFVERRRHIEGLAAVASFFKETNVGLDIADRFGKLAFVLSDLDNGKRNPVLEPAKPSGRPPDAANTWMERMRVVMGFEARVYPIPPGQAEEVLTKAARDIAKDYPEFDRLKRNSGDHLAASIMSWRKMLTEGTVKDTTVRGIFNKQHKLLLQDLEALSPENRKLLADELLSATASRIVAEANE